MKRVWWWVGWSSYLSWRRGDEMRPTGRTALGVIGSRRICFVLELSSSSLSVLMHVVEPNADNTAVIKSLADAMDQINRKVKAVMLRVDECEKRLDAQQVLSRVGGAFKSGGVKSDVTRLMEASEEPVKPDLSDQVDNDRTPNFLQRIKSDMRDFIHEHYDTSESVPLGSVQRDAPAPKAVVRPSHELAAVSFDLEEDVVKRGKARGEEDPELVDQEHLEERSLELALHVSCWETAAPAFDHGKELVDPLEKSREEILEERSLQLACASRKARHHRGFSAVLRVPYWETVAAAFGHGT